MSEHGDDVLIHTEAWWIRALEDALTPEEARQWAAHRARCADCQREWDAMRHVERWLQAPPAVPALPELFTAQTVARATQRLQRQRWWMSFAATLMVGLVTWFVLSSLGMAVVHLERLIQTLLIGWQPLLGSLTRALMGLSLVWRDVLPLVAGGIVGCVVLLMPNGVIATAMLVWLARRRAPAQSA